MKKLFVAAVIASGLVGCASVPMADPKQDSALKTFSIPADKAGVFIYRNETIGAAVKLDVALDGRAIGKTAANTYLYKEVALGHHTVTSAGENTDSVEFDAKSGTLTYVWQEVKMGFLSPRTKLHIVGEEDGKKGVQETNLAETR